MAIRGRSFPPSTQVVRPARMAAAAAAFALPAIVLASVEAVGRAHTAHVVTSGRAVLVRPVRDITPPPPSPQRAAIVAATRPALERAHTRYEASSGRFIVTRPMADIAPPPPSTARASAITVATRPAARRPGGSATIVRPARGATTGAQVPDVGSLPAINRQLPDFAAYTGRELAYNNYYVDPVSGVRVWRMSSATVPVANTGVAHDYASGPTQISREWGSQQHTLLTFTAGAHRLVDFQRGVGFSNWRDFPATSYQLGFSFANRNGDARIAYYGAGTQLRKHNTATALDLTEGFFPKSFATEVGASVITWLHTDKNDVWFYLMPADQSKVIAWNSQTNQTLTRVLTGLDEPHGDRDGGYVCMIDASTSNNMKLWRLSDDTLIGTGSGRAGVHVEGIRGYYLAQDSNLATCPQFWYRSSDGLVTETLDGDSMSAGLQHRAGQWVQSEADLLKQWQLVSNYDDGPVTIGAWTLDSGQIYWTPCSFVYQQSIPGVLSVRQIVTGDTTRISRQLTRVLSLGAMVEGSFYFDVALARCYVWAVGGASPLNRVRVIAPAKSHDALVYARADGSDARYLTHHFNVPPVSYDASPKGTISPDGKLVMFTSNMNDSDGRNDDWVVEVPLTASSTAAASRAPIALATGEASDRARARRRAGGASTVVRPVREPAAAPPAVAPRPAPVTATAAARRAATVARVAGRHTVTTRPIATPAAARRAAITAATAAATERALAAHTATRRAATILRAPRAQATGAVPVKSPTQVTLVSVATSVAGVSVPTHAELVN